MELFSARIANAIGAVLYRNWLKERLTSGEERMSINRPGQSKTHPLKEPCLPETGSDDEHTQKNAESRPVDRRDKIRLAQHTRPNHQSRAKNCCGGLVEPVR